MPSLVMHTLPIPRAKMILQSVRTILAVTSIVICLNACGSSHPVTGPGYQYIPFSTKELSPSKPLDIQVYHSRLELPGPFEEIGAVKMERQLSEDEMKTIAGSHGADGIVLEGQNALLLKLTQKIKKEERINDTKEI